MGIGRRTKQLTIYAHCDRSKQGQPEADPRDAHGVGASSKAPGPSCNRPGWVRAVQVRLVKCVVGPIWLSPCPRLRGSCRQLEISKKITCYVIDWSDDIRRLPSPLERLARGCRQRVMWLSP